MLINGGRNSISGGQFEVVHQETAEYLTFRDILLFLRRKVLILAMCAIAGLGLGVLYLSKTPAQYVAVTRVVMDPGQAKIASQDASSGTIIIESAEIASQVEIVQSEAVAQSVIKELNLTEDPEIQSSSSWRSAVKGWLNDALVTIGLKEPAAEPGALTEEQLMRRTMAGFLSRVYARRVGQSYVLEIGYTSTNPDHAAMVANAIARTYIRTGMEERSQAAKQGAAWLEDRLIEIDSQARQAQLAVETYRASNGITPVGIGASLDQQQLVETSSQLLQAQAATATELAKLETIQRLMAGDEQQSEIDDSQNSAQIQKIRDEIRAATARLDAMRLRYQPENSAVVAAAAEVDGLKQELQDEFHRIESVYRSNLEVARARERILEAALADLKERGVDNNVARVNLAELESRATTYRRMYENVLQQLISAVQVQSFPLGSARLVTAATAPMTKSSPKTSIILPLSLILGLTAGLALSGWREATDRSLEAGRKLDRELGLPVLSRVPMHAMDRPAHRLNQRIFVTSDKVPLRAILDKPYSEFSESIRHIKSAIDASHPANARLVIGVTSIAAGEGKTTVAVNLAQLYRNEGVDAVAVDADFQTSSLSTLIQSADCEARLNLCVLAQDSPAPKVASRKGARAQPAAPARLPELAPLVEDICLPVATLDQLCQGYDTRQRYGHLPALKDRLANLRADHQILVVDMSSLSNFADARAICTMVDGIVIVVGNPRKMTLDKLSAALGRFGRTQFNLYGLVFNRSGKEKPGGNLFAARKVVT